MCWFSKRAKRKVCKRLIDELFVLNRRDGCYDPYGSIDASSMHNLIEDVVERSPGKRAKRIRRD